MAEELKPAEKTVEIDPQKYERVLKAMRDEQSLPLAIIAGAVSALFSAVIWGLVAYFTKHEYGILAIGAGALVGFSVRFLGKGVDMPWRVTGAVFAVLGCALGKIASLLIFMAAEYKVGIGRLLGSLDFEIMKAALVNGFDIMDLVFYGLAGYEGFQFAVRSVKVEDVVKDQ